MNDTTDTTASGSLPDLPQDFIRKLTAIQLELMIYIASLLGGAQDMEDILQETNLALCRKCADYDPERPFIAWAKAFAKFEVLKHRTRRSRERVLFDDTVFEKIAAKLSSDSPAARPANQTVTALMNCFDKLNTPQQTALRAKYLDGDSLKAMACRMACSEAAVGMLLYRIRRLLSKCIQNTLQEGKLA